MLVYPLTLDCVLDAYPTVDNTLDMSMSTLEL